MQNYNSAFTPTSSIQLFGNQLHTADLFLILAAFIAALVAISLLIKFLSSRPHVVAAFAVTGTITGIFALFAGSITAGLSITVLGSVALLLCAVSHGRNNQPVRGK